ncbi:MAG: HD domain-containing protein [Desulfobacterales bacterium]|nr:HD domain-containing protein [Desulfobacterales bacterium]
MPKNSSIKEEPLYNSRIINAYIKLIKRKYPSVNIRELLDYADMKPQEVDDQGHWFTQTQVDRFYEHAVNLTGNENIAREAGRYAASPESIGAMRQYVLGLAAPAKVYELIGKTTRNFTRSSKYESRLISPNKVEILVSPYKGTVEKPFQCENRKGFFEAILMVFNNKPPHIEHPECIFRGDKVCRYIITWEKNFNTYYKILRNYLTLFVLIAAMVSLALLPFKTWALLSAVFVIVLLTAALVGEFLDKRNLKETMHNLQEASDQLVNQIEVNYNNRLVTRDIGQIINRRYNLEDVLKELVGVLEHRLDFDRGMIMLANPQKTQLRFWGGFGYSEDQLKFLRRLSFHLDNPSSKGAFVIAFREQKPFLINNIDEIQDTLSERSLNFAKKMGGKSFICCPIICDEESIGILAVDNIRSKRLLVHSDLSLLMGISHFIGIFIRHTEHLEARQNQLQSILKVLVSSIDARDPVTKGHSEWVAEYAVGICDELELDKDYREMIRIAALLHDYGKIGIPDSMLKKADKLTEYEYEYVKLHADKTREILSEINFEGALREVPEIAGAHHEKIDGTGYPMGLKGEEIPFGARIIAVADYFEALTANRYYSEPLPPGKALELVAEKSGTYFDKQVLEAFIRYYMRTYGESLEAKKTRVS